MKNVVSVPNFMTTLRQEIIDEFEDNCCKIIACGVDPKDNILYIISNELEVKIIKPTEKSIPIDARPEDHGQFISVCFKNDLKNRFYIDSNLALIHAENCIDKAQLFVNGKVLCDIES